MRQEHFKHHSNRSNRFHDDSGRGMHHHGDGHRDGHRDGHGHGRRGHGHDGKGRDGRGRGGRARRGDVRLALLALLAENPANGYALIKKIQEKTAGVWRTSPGSVYPTLAQLVDEGLIAPSEVGEGRNEYELTEDGRAYALENKGRIDSLWDQSSGDLEGAGALRHAFHHLRGVLRQVEAVADQEKLQEATAAVNDLTAMLQAELALEENDGS